MATSIYVLNVGQKKLFHSQKPLLDPKNAPEDLELVYQYDMGDAWKKIWFIN